MQCEGQGKPAEIERVKVKRCDGREIDMGKFLAVVPRGLASSIERDLDRASREGAAGNDWDAIPLVKRWPDTSRTPSGVRRHYDLCWIRERRERYSKDSGISCK